MTDSQQVRGRDTGPADPAGSPAMGDARPEAPGQETGTGRSEQVAPQHDAHGQSIASWTCVSAIMFGALVMCIAVVVTSVWLFVVGAVVVVLGVISGKVLSAMGFGVSGRPGH